MSLGFEKPEEDMLGADVKPAGVLGGTGVAEGVVLLLLDADAMVWGELTLIGLEGFYFGCLLKRYLGQR